MTKFSKTSINALSQINAHLAPSVIISNMATWVVEAIDENRKCNTGYRSIAKDWSENWGSDAASAVSVYEDGPNGSDWSDLGLLENDDIRAALVVAVAEQMSSAIDDELEEIKFNVTNAADLSSLEDALKVADEYAADNNVDVASLYDATSLPVFGGDAVDEVGVHSWNESSVLRFATSSEGWNIVARA